MITITAFSLDNGEEVGLLDLDLRNTEDEGAKSSCTVCSNETLWADS